VTKQVESELFVLTNLGDERELTVRFPDITLEMDKYRDMLIHTLKFLMKLFRIKPENIHYVFEGNLGRELFLPRTLNNQMTAMMASIESPSGRFPGGVHTCESDLKCNLVEAVAALKLLRQYQSLIRSRPKKSLDDRVKKTSQEELREVIALLFGLKEEGANKSYFGTLIRQSMAQLTKINEPNFPGGWIHALRERNNARSTEALLARCGYVPKVGSMLKLQNVVMTKVKTRQIDDKMVKTLIPCNQEHTPEGITPTEFRVAVCMALPLIDPQSNKSIKDQLRRDGLSCREPNTLRAYDSLSELADVVNTAFAIKVDIPDKKSKSAPVHFEHVRARAERMSAHVPIVDASGTEYPRVMAVPRHILQPLAKLFNHKLAEETHLTNKGDEGRNATEDASEHKPAEDISSSNMHENG